MISTCYLPPDFSSTCSTQNLLITFVVNAALYNTTVKLIKNCLKCETVREMRDCCGRVSEVREGEESACGARGMRSGRYRCEGRRDTPGTFQWHSCANMYSRQPQPGPAAGKDCCCGGGEGSHSSGKVAQGHAEGGSVRPASWWRS